MLRFGQKVDALIYQQVADLGIVKWNGPFEPFFRAAAGKARSIKFNLTGISPRALGRGFAENGTVTMAELNAILTDPTLLSKTTFFKDGVEASAELARSLLLP